MEGSVKSFVFVDKIELVVRKDIFVNVRFWSFCFRDLSVYFNLLGYEYY